MLYVSDFYTISVFVYFLLHLFCIFLNCNSKRRIRQPLSGSFRAYARSILVFPDQIFCLNLLFAVIDFTLKLLLQTSKLK